MDNHLLDIISDIKKESCVLILGPDILDFDKKSFFETLCNEFVCDDQYKGLIDTAPPYVFVNEDLLQLQPTTRETTVVRIMERFYQKQSAFDAPLSKISQIPFHLIISLLPDERLQKIYKEQNFRFNYNYYPREEPPIQVEKPTSKTPLIYNLLGDLNIGEVIITFDHLFAFLTGIMGKRELPHVLQESLKRARTFLFLGVHFEKWYVQLLLRIITSNDKKEKYTILNNSTDSEVYTFIAKRLELDFIPSTPLDFLNDLHKECEKQNLLKTKTKVFLSYSHKDKKAVQMIANHLKQNAIEVIYDDDSMLGGQKIEDFIETIRDTDIIIPIISEFSLLSPWVIKEIFTTLTKTSKFLLPCYLDETFMDNGFSQKAGKVVDEKINEIDEKIRQQGKTSTDDLFTERKSWTDYYKNLDYVLDEIKKRKCRPINGDFEMNINKIIADILKFLTR